MHYLISIFGIICSVLLLKYREKVGDMIGEADWMNKVGGIYNLVIIFALLLFFWSIAVLTGTTDIFLRPLILLLPGIDSQAGPGSTGPDFYID